MNAVTIRSIVDDVETATEFDTERLDFEVQLHLAPGFAALERGTLRLLLNAPGAGGAGRTCPTEVAPSRGWNRFQIEIEDGVTTVERLKGRGASVRNELVVGNGGEQILLEDPAGTVIELFEPA